MLPTLRGGRVITQAVTEQGRAVPFRPPHIDVMVGGRPVRIDRRLTEYFLFQTLWVLYKGVLQLAGEEWARPRLGTRSIY